MCEMGWGFIRAIVPDAILSVVIRDLLSESYNLE